MKTYKTNIKPGSATAQKWVVKAGFFALGRTIAHLSATDDEVMREIAAWPEGYSFSMNVLPAGPCLVMEKLNNKMHFIGLDAKPDADMIVEVKNLSIAFKMIMAQLGAHDVYARHGIGVTGNIADSMKLIRIIYKAEAMLFPKILNKNILKESPDETLQLQVKRLKAITLGVILGK